MPRVATASDLPLAVRTPANWAIQALSDPLALLQDHAHLERKAASNALDLLGRWPERVDLRESHPGADRFVEVLTSIARDELRHLGQVLRLLRRRGGHLERAHSNPYAAALHREVRRGQGRRELQDRLLVSALIEQRSHERFGLLAEAAAETELADLYRGLERSEFGHFRAFVELAEALPELGASTERRFRELLVVEGAIAGSQDPGPRMHSGW